LAGGRSRPPAPGGASPLNIDDGGCASGVGGCGLTAPSWGLRSASFGGLVIEGTLTTTHLGAHNETHIRNLIWDWSKYGLTVVYTGSVEETCDYLAHMRWSYAEEPSLEAAQEAAMMSMRVYAGKKKAVTPENYFLESLKMIPNVTGRIAKAITAKWPTQSALSKAFEGKPNLLHGLKVDEKGSIGKALSAKICKYVRPTGSQ